MRLTFPDDLLDRLEGEAERTGRPVETLISQHLQRSMLHPITDRLLIVPAAERAKLEDVLGPLKDAPTLVKAVAAMHTVTFQNVKIPLEPWQMEEIHRRAEKAGRTVREETELMVKGVADLAFTGMHG